MTRRERKILFAIRKHLVCARDAIDVGSNGKVLISATDIRKGCIAMALGLVEEELNINELTIKHDQ